MQAKQFYDGRSQKVGIFWEWDCEEAEGSFLELWIFLYLDVGGGYTVVTIHKMVHSTLLSYTLFKSFLFFLIMVFS